MDIMFESPTITLAQVRGGQLTRDPTTFRDALKFVSNDPGLSVEVMHRVRWAELPRQRQGGQRTKEPKIALIFLVFGVGETQ
jgi:hypothetical protein